MNIRIIEDEKPYFEYYSADGVPEISFGHDFIKDKEFDFAFNGIYLTKTEMAILTETIASKYQSLTGNKARFYYRTVNQNIKKVSFDDNFYSWLNKLSFEDLQDYTKGNAEFLEDFIGGKEETHPNFWISNERDDEIRTKIQEIIDEVLNYFSNDVNIKSEHEMVVLHEAAHDYHISILFNGAAGQILSFIENLKRDLQNNSEVRENIEVQKLISDLESMRFQFLGISEAYAMIREITRGVYASVNQITEEGIMKFKYRLIEVLKSLKRDFINENSELEGQIKSYSNNQGNLYIDLHNLGTLILLSKGEIFNKDIEEINRFKFDNIFHSPEQIWLKIEEFTKDPRGFLQSIDLFTLNILLEKQTSYLLMPMIKKIIELQESLKGREIDSKLEFLENFDTDPIYRNLIHR